MDRSILEGDPHSVLEAMAICAYAIGSDIGCIYKGRISLGHFKVRDCHKTS